MNNAMDNEHPTDSKSVTDNLSPNDEMSTTDSPPSNSNGLIWKWAVGVVAIVVIGILVFPLFNRQTTPSVVDATEPSVEVTTQISFPETASTIADDTTAEDQFKLGNQFYETGQLDEAVTAYQKAIELDPEYQGAYANLGVTYYQQQQFDLAASQYEKALELNPEDGEVAYNLGALYLQQALMEGDAPDNDLLDKSVAQLQQALEIAPNLAEPHFTLGVAYFFLDDEQKATEAFESYLATGTDPQAQQEAEGYLQQLKN